MEVKPGYKKTEVGEFPEEWEVDCVENLAQITTGEKNTQDRIEDGQYPFFVRSQTVERINSYSYDGEAVLTAGDGVGTGKVFHHINAKFDVHQRVYRVSNFTPRLNGYFFFLYFSSRFYNRIMQMTAKSSVDSVRREMIARMLVPLPPKAEQEAISNALIDADSLVESLEQLIAKKRQLKQGAMQELLTGKRRLPGFEVKSGYKQTEAGMIPEDWDAKAIGCDIDLMTGFPFPSAGYAKSGVRLLRGSNVKRGATDWADDITQYWPSVLPDIARYELREDDLVIAMDGSLVGRSSAQLKKKDLPALLLQRVARIRCSKNLDVGYLAAFVSSNWFVKYSDSVKTVTAIPHISPADIRNFTIPIPPTLAEQEAIASILSDMVAEIAALEAKVAKARSIKQGMMQELLTGKVRLI